MNRIYRRIWNATRRCWVVASELSSPRGKKSSKRCISSAMPATAVLLCLSFGLQAQAVEHCNDAVEVCTVEASEQEAASLWAELPFSTNTSSRFGILAVNDTVYGTYASSTGDYNAVFGKTAEAHGYGVAVGYFSNAKGPSATAIGANASAIGEGSVAVGRRAYVYGNSDSAIAIGNNARAGAAYDYGAIAIGGSSKADYDSIAIGYQAKATGGYSVALGRDSIADVGSVVSVGNSYVKRRIINVAAGNVHSGSTDAVNGDQLYRVQSDFSNVKSIAQSAQTLANTANKNANTALASTGTLNGLLSQTAVDGTVRIGGSNRGNVLDVRNSAGSLRRVFGVGSAILSNSSTDAVNGSQLFSTNQEVIVAKNHAAVANTNAEAALIKLARMDSLLSQEDAAGVVKIGSGTGGTMLNVSNKDGAARRLTGLADGLVSAGSTDAVNGSQLATVYSTAIGAQNAAELAGKQSSAAVAQTEALARLLSNGTVATDQGAAKTSGTGALAVGIYTEAKGTAATALGRTAKAMAEGSIAIGDRVKIESASSANSIAIGSFAKTGPQKDLMAFGRSAEATGGEGAMALGVESKASHASAVALGAGSATTGVNQISVGNAGIKRTIVNVADGDISATSHDAVTGAQLFATNQTAQQADKAAKSAVADAGSALSKATVLEGLIQETGTAQIVRLGAQNDGTILNVNNKSGKQRTITGIAPGAISTHSSEAVTGSQLYGTNLRVDSLEGLVRQDATAGTIRLGVQNTGTTVDVRNKNSAKRRITGLADAVLSTTSSDAVTGSQLAATNAGVANAERSIGNVATRVGTMEAASRHIAIGEPGADEKPEAGRLGVAIGDAAIAAPKAEGAVAVGSYSQAEGEDSVALGRAAWVQESAARGFALGSRSVVEETDGLALGSSSTVKQGSKNAVAIGAGSIASESNSVSFGHANLQRRLTNIARGTADHNATTVGQLNDTLATLGGGAKLDAAGNVTSPTYTVQNTRQHTVGDALTILDGAVLRTSADVDRVQGQLRSVFQNATGLQANGINQVVLAGANGALMTNLADGRIAAGSRDAVNGSQLYAAERRIERNRADLDAMQSEWGSQKSMQPQSNGNPIDFGGARLTGIADAYLSADSSDVVRGSQLYATNVDVQHALREAVEADQRLTSIESMGRRVAIGAPLDDGEALAGRLGIALGDSAYASLDKDGAVALGSYSRALGENSVALGRASWVQDGAVGGFALGTGSLVGEQKGVALGADSSVTKGARNAVALGAGSIAVESNTASFGDGPLQRRLTNLASGTASHNAATVGQLRSALVAIGGDVDANGNIVGPQFNVQGGTQSTVNDALTSLDGAVINTASRVANVEGQLRSVFQDTPTARADGLNQITLAGANGMILSNVGNGLIAAGSRDAVNGGQLHSMQQQLNGRMDGLEQRIDGQPQSRMMALASDDAGTPASNPVVEEPTSPASNDDKVAANTGNAPKSSPQPKAEAPESPKPQVDTAELEKMLARANDYSDGIARDVDARLNKMDKRFNRMAAMSSAQTAMAMNTAGLATYNRLGAGVGYAEGESAMAVGYQRVLNDKGSATFSLNGAFTNSGERSMGVGVGIGW